MFKFLLVSLFASMSLFAQVGLNLSGSVPNGAEIGLDYQPSKYFRAGANYGYIHYGNAANLKVSAGLPFLYAYGSLNYLGTNSRAESFLANKANGIIDESLGSMDMNGQSMDFSDLRFSNRDVRIVDLGVSGGIGIKAGWLFLEGGIRTAQLRGTIDNKIDMVFDKFDQALANNAPDNATYYQASGELAEIKSDLKAEVANQASLIPGGLRALPELRIGLRIPLGK